MFKGCLLRRVRQAAFLVAGLALVVACGSSADSTDVLFIGNSHVAENDLPDMFARFATSGGHRVNAASSAPGGFYLRDHVQSSKTMARLRRGSWDYVILQEQSVVPSVRSDRSGVMMPAVRDLAREATVYGAEPILMLTWGRDNGLPDIGFRNYQAMQAAVTDGYRRVAEATELSIAPVGEAWALAREIGVPLYQPDGYHPDVAGTYLAAAVIYATLFDEDPREVTFDGGLPDTLAASLRGFAARIAFDERSDWVVGTES